MMEHLNISYDSHFISTPKQYFELLEKEIYYPKEHKIYGRFLAPRLATGYGDGDHIKYSFAGTTLDARPWTPTLLKIKQLVEAKTGYKYNFCLVNKYRNGKDSIGKHKDDERGLAKNFPIASVSLGETRSFVFSKPGHRSIKFYLNNGSLIVMHPPTNEFWFHEIPKEPTQNGVRINLTFRKILIENACSSSF